MPSIRNKAGFTLIELIVVLVIVAILAITAFNRFWDLDSKALEAQESGVIGSLRVGIKNYYAESLSLNREPRYPEALDSAQPGEAAQTNPIFEVVLDYPITARWRKLSELQYMGPTGTIYAYDGANGMFDPVGQQASR